MSRKSQQVGGAFERWIEAQHEAAKILGILSHVEHNQAQAKVVRGGLRYVGKGVSDYTGTLAGNGRALAVEAKSTQKPRLPRAEIKKKQAEHMDAVARAGGLALLLVEFRQETKDAEFLQRFAIPWLEVPWETKKSAESISVEDLAAWAVVPDCYLLRWHAGGKSSVPRRVYPRE